MISQSQRVEDPYQCPLPDFIIGQDCHGRWLVRDAQGLIGGVFRDRHAAERFAAFESGHRQGAIRFAPQGVRLDLTGPLPRYLTRGFARDLSHDLPHEATILVLASRPEQTASPLERHMSTEPVRARG